MHKSLRIIWPSVVSVSLLLSACGDESPTPPTDSGTADSGTIDSGAPDSGTADAGATDSGAADAGAADAGAADAGAADAGSTTTLDNGTYAVTTWTCGTHNVRAYATMIGLGEIRFTVNGSAAQNSASYISAPSCTRTTNVTLTYPAPGTYTSTSAMSYTCSSACPPAGCTSGAQPVIVDTYSFTKTATSFTATRTLGTVIGLQLAAGCQSGDTETLVWTRQ